MISFQQEMIFSVPLPFDLLLQLPFLDGKGVLDSNECNMSFSKFRPFLFHYLSSFERFTNPDFHSIRLDTLQNVSAP